jgi:hypothetical protein
MISAKNLLKRISHIGGRIYIQTLFDPHQTHAVYGLDKCTFDQCKDQLKQLGANRFRTVNCKNAQGKPNGFLILCFNANKIIL